MTFRFLMVCAWVIGALVCWLIHERETAVAMLLLALRDIYLIEPVRKDTKP